MARLLFSMPYSRRNGLVIINASLQSKLMSSTFSLLSSLSKEWSRDNASPQDFTPLHATVLALGAKSKEEALACFKALEEVEFDLGHLGTLALLSDRPIVGQALSEYGVNVEDYIALGEELGFSTGGEDYPFVAGMLYCGDARYEKVLKRAFEWGLDANAAWEVDRLLGAYDVETCQISLVSECIRGLNVKWLKKLLPAIDTNPDQEEEHSRWYALSRMMLRRSDGYFQDASLISQYFLPGGSHALKTTPWEVKGDDDFSLGHLLALSYARVANLSFENAKTLKLWQPLLEKTLPSPQEAFKLLENQVSQGSSNYSNWWVEALTPDLAAALVIPTFIQFFKDQTKHNSFSYTAEWEILLNKLIDQSSSCQNVPWQDPDMPRQIFKSVVEYTPTLKTLDKLMLVWPGLDTNNHFENQWKTFKALVVERESASAEKDSHEEVKTIRDKISLFLNTPLVSLYNPTRPRL